MPILQPPLGPRRYETPLWPILMAGGAGLAALGLLALLGMAQGAAVVAALLAVAAVTALATIAADRQAEAHLDDPAAGNSATEREPTTSAALINALPDPILVVSASEADDLTGRRLVFANSAARQLFRIDRDEGLLVSVVRDPQALEAADEALFGGKDSEAVFETGGVQSRVLRVIARPMGLALDGAHLALLAFRDETEARQVERTRVDFLANASHELRTPLASLSGFIETLRGHAKGDPRAQERFLSIMQAQAERMRRLIDDLMSLSRIELIEHVAPSGEVDLAAAVSDVLDAISPLLKEQEIKVEARLAPARVTGERDQIVQVAQNLIDNAVKYTPRGGTVKVVVEAGATVDAGPSSQPEAMRLSLLTPDHTGETYGVLRVTDEGPGIAREHLPRLTERFYRVEGQKSGERSGTGLGLAIVKHIVNRHRGALAVESAPGRGASFSVCFPEPAGAHARAVPGVVAKVS